MKNKKNRVLKKVVRKRVMRKKSVSKKPNKLSVIELLERELGIAR